MEALIQTFHIDWRLIVAQMINFAIVFVVLWRFVFRPLSKIMTERTATIEKGLQQARDIEALASSTKTEQAELLKHARQEANAIVANAQAAAAEQRTKALTTAKAEVTAIVQQGKEQMAQERVAMVRDARKELADVVIAATGQVISDMADSKLDKKMVEKSLSGVTK